MYITNITDDYISSFANEDNKITFKYLLLWYIKWLNF